MRQFLLLFCFLSHIRFGLLSNAQAYLQFCESYVECTAVALLEERLCLGNSRLRPYWLPDQNDINGCHLKLKNDYRTLEKLEEDLDNKWTECLIENSVPFDFRKEQYCTPDIIRRAPRFSSSRMINYVPTQCFTGFERRRKRECGQLEACCDAVSKCAHVWKTSQLARKAEGIRQNLRRRAKECEGGKPIFVLPMEESLSNSIEEDNKIDSNSKENERPQGNINVRIRPEGHVNVHFSTTVNNDANSQTSSLGDGGFIVQSSPKLYFPNPGKNNFPTNLNDHNEAFEKALNRTNAYKKRIEENESNYYKNFGQGKVVQKTLDSLLNAAQASFNSNGIPSGSRHTLIIENPLSIRGQTVTSQPVIFVKKEQQDKSRFKTLNTVGKAGGCGDSAMKLKRVEKILTQLGENRNSTDMKEISELVHAWHSEVRTKAFLIKDKVKAKQLQDNIEQLIEYFDSVSEKLVKGRAKFDDADYPNEDASIAEKECDPLNSSEVPENNENHLNSWPTSFATVDLSIDDAPAEADSKSEIAVEALAKLKEKMGTGKNGCDEYLQCRSEMHVAVDGCAESFASKRVDLAESADTIVMRNRSLCKAEDVPLTHSLISVFNRRIQKMRSCLLERNEKYFAENVCIPYSSKDEAFYIAALARIYAHSYESSTRCFDDANLIQERCTKLRACCPNFENCRDDVIDITDEELLISRTAQFNEKRQECRKEAVRGAFKESLKKVIREGKPINHMRNLLNNL